MAKSFQEALIDGFEHVTHVNDLESLKDLREEGVRVDDEGYYSFSFGEHKEYELCIEPLSEDNQFQIAIYKNRIPLNVKLPIWSKKQAS